MGFIPFVPTAGNITVPIPIADGGTGQITKAAALNALASNGTVSGTLATSSDFGVGNQLTVTSTSFLSTTRLFGAISPAVVTLTDAATITVDANAGNDFRVTIAASRNMGAPSNAVDGERITISVTQSGAGSFTITWNSGAGGYEFSSGLPAPTLSTAAGTTDVLSFIYDTGRGKWLMTGYVLGFA